MKHNLRYISTIFFLYTFLLAFGQADRYINYIAIYKDIAIEQMVKYKIPASITMAQGLLESGAGCSTLAVKGNNHFGIKCHNDWRGPYMLRNDDAPNEKFRVYKKVEDSYEDHSRFLTERRRYALLFNLSITDYKGWANGLKAAGYATSPTYAKNLIQIIERYNLTELDYIALVKHKKKDKEKSTNTLSLNKTQVNSLSHEVKRNNNNYYVIAKTSDTYKSIAAEFELNERRLRRYNEVDKYYALKPGDIVYLEKKQKKAHKSLKNKYYVLQQNESLYMVSQKFGMQLKTLYKVNKFNPDHTPIVGEKIRLR